MKHIINSTLYKSFICTLTLFSGCTSAGSGARVSDAPDPRLDSSISAPKELLLVNSLAVGDVSIPPQAKTVSKEDVTKLITEAFRSSSEIPVGISKAYPYVISTDITSYQDRIGSAAGATQMAQVSMRIKIIEKTSSKVVWQGSFSANDESLSENLLNSGVQTNSGSGLGFSSARDLLKRGFEEISSSFASARLQAFTK